jgi:hypothetical protein
MLKFSAGQPFANNGESVLKQGYMGGGRHINRSDTLPPRKGEGRQMHAENRIVLEDEVRELRGKRQRLERKYLSMLARDPKKRPALRKAFVDWTVASKMYQDANSRLIRARYPHGDWRN